MAADEHRLTLKTLIGVHRRLSAAHSDFFTASVRAATGAPLGRERLPYTASLLQHLFEEAHRPPIARLAGDELLRRGAEEVMRYKATAPDPGVPRSRL